MSNLPSGWAAPSLSEICDLNPKHDPDTNREISVSFVPMPNVSDERGTIEEPVDRQLSEVWKGYTHFQNGDVIFAKITPCMENGKSAVATGLTNGLACGSTEFHVLRPQGGTLPEYIWRYIRQSKFRSDAAAQMTGAVGQRRVPKQYLEQQSIPLPPLAEQRRIVKKLDDLSARSKSARTHLKAIDKLVERYKLSILSQMIFLQGFEETTIGNVIEDIRYGTSTKCNYDEQGTPVLRIPNIQNGRIDQTDLKYGSFQRTDIEKLSLQIGDILVIRSNGSADLVGRSALVENTDTHCLFAGYLIRLRLDKQLVVPKFFQLCFECDEVRAYIEMVSKSTSGINNINASQLKALSIPCPDLFSQREIVRRIETAFAKIDRLAEDAKKALKLVDRLDERILAKAFAGALVPQDPNDEPASALLERIRTERAKETKPKRGRMRG